MKAMLVTTDSFHREIYNNNIHYVKSALEPLVSLSSYMGDTMDSQAKLTKVVLDYLGGHPQPFADLFSSTLSTHTYELLRNASPEYFRAYNAPIPPSIIDSLFLSSITMRRTRDPTIFNLLIKLQVPEKNTMVFTSELSCDEIFYEQSCALKNYYDDEWGFFDIENEELGNFFISAGHTPLRQIRDLFDKLSTFGQREGLLALDVLMETLTPHRVMVEIAAAEPENGLFMATLGSKVLLQEIEQCMLKQFPDDPSVLAKYKKIIDELKIYLGSYSAEEIEYARSKFRNITEEREGLDTPYNGLIQRYPDLDLVEEGRLFHLKQIAVGMDYIDSEDSSDEASSIHSFDLED
jgi:hypothetical protein